MNPIRKKYFSFTIIAMFFLLFATSFVSANPISEVSRSKAVADLKAELLKTYGSSYSTVEMLLNAGMKAYDTLISIPDNSVNNDILRELTKTYYPSFSTILMLYKANKESYDKLNKQ